MPAATFTVALSVTFTPPGANANSGQSSFPVTGTYNGQTVGQIDVPSGTVQGTSYAIPFGSVTAAKLLVVKNMMSSDIGVRLNGAGVDTFRLTPGGEFMYASPAGPAMAPLSSASIITTSSPTADEQVLFICVGE